EAALVALTFVLVYVHVLRETEGSPITAFLLAVAAAIVSCGFFQPRPHLWTYLFLALTITAMMALRRSPASWRYAWLLPVTYLLWSNVHAGVIVGVGIVFVFALGDVLEARASAEARAALLTRAKNTALLGIACAATTLATPYGWRMYENMGATLGNTTMINIVSEWASPNFHDADGKVLEAFLALLVYGIAFTRRKREWAPLLILTLMVHESLAASRNVPLFAISCIMLFAGDIYSSFSRHLSRFGSMETSLFGRYPSAISVAAVAVAICASSGMRAATVLRSDGRSGAPLAPRIATASFKLQSFPAAACRFMEAEEFPVSIKLYNIYDIGGYMIWRLPQYPVYIDGRADVYFGQTLDEAGKIYQMPYDWRAIFDRRGVDVIVTTASQNQTRVYLTAPDWALVYADRPELKNSGKNKTAKVNALIFVKRVPKYDALIARCRRDCPATAQMRQIAGAGDYASLR
ncbi:MAG: hypothetical protein ABIY70_16810, partial [Capsulimonas sp.]|uniref:hypothetical protein n=1 Tax=Capsulimonas sp. TaxID=2494211 RepID=UPI003263EB74